MGRVSKSGYRRFPPPKRKPSDHPTSDKCCPCPDTIGSLQRRTSALRHTNMGLLATLLLALFGCVAAGSFNLSLCQTRVQNGTFGTAGVTDRNGELTANLSLAEGYEYPFCLRNCGGGFEPHSFRHFSEQATLWFLPWFTLVAQVPLCTQHKMEDILVMFLTIGSPTTAFYSLFLTIFDRNWLKSYCKLTGLDADKTLQDISEVLFSLHQFSFAILAVGGNLSLRDRQWWARLRKWFVARRRHMEASAYAQLFLTVMVYLLAVVPDAYFQVGDNATAHGLAIGNMWMWLIPLVWGWFAVGTHHGRRKDVLEELCDSLEMTTKSAYSESADIISLPEAIPHEHNLTLETDTRPSHRHHTILGFTVRGDTLADGPFYNYARCVTWTYVSKKLVDAYRRSVFMPNNSDLTAIATGADDASLNESFLSKDAESLKAKHLERLETGTTATVDSGGLISRRIKAFIVAFFLHGLFGWSAFMIDYTTPTIGVGCRAFICGAYTLVSLFSCILLAVSSTVSDQLKFGTTELADGGTRRMAIAAVLMRVLGKVLAIANGVFIIAACFFEFIGVYESCFCKSDYLGLRGRAFISFLSSDEAAQIARPFWYAGSGIAMITVLVVCFAYFTKIHQKAKTD